MKRFSKLNEDIISFEDKITGDYKSLKRGVIDLIGGTIDSSELVDYKNFIDEYISSGYKKENDIISSFVEDNDIFNFYLKYKGDIDELLTDKEFFEQPGKDNDIFSLYDNIIVGTKLATYNCMEILQKEIF